MSDIAIKIENLKKQYKLGAIGGQTLNAELQSWWARKRGKEDPNLKIGQDYSNFGESFYALNGINLEIKKGEALGIIGGNGAGKSTLLKILSRVTAPTEGDVWIDGRVASMLEVGTGFHGELTGRENIYMNGAILGMTRKEVDEKIESIIDFSECRQFIDTPVKRYSSGMYVKLAFAVASHLDAEIMVMDEVLAVGDMKFQKKCLGKMGDEAEGGKTVLYVSHNMATIRNLCSRCIVLNKGMIIYDGNVEDAIKIYMDYGSNSSITKINNKLFDRGTAPIRLGQKAMISYVEILNRKSPVFDAKECMNLMVEIETYTGLENTLLAMELYYADLTCIGFGDVKVGNLLPSSGKEINVVFAMSALPEGQYAFKLNLHQQDDFGNFAGSIDQTDYIYFEVLSQNQNLVWHREWWGNFRLNDYYKLI